MNSPPPVQDLFGEPDTLGETAAPSTEPSSRLMTDSRSDTNTLSPFESIITSYPPILDSLLCQLPTNSILGLYHTSKYLQTFLRQYPLAWKTLSFRLPQPALILGSPGNETPDGRERQSKAYALDALLKQVVAPYGKVLRSLDLCNTAVSGIALIGCVLSPRIDTLAHLSVRGCKNVSIKYHIVPFLEPYVQQDSPWVQKDLALKSLYTYRCRHHRRRPYLPSSLVRKDSDSDPTHQLIEICHQLGIWTDTAWCPTPAGRCFRRKDYHSGRAGPGNMEVWVPFDRLWRSGNRLGPGDDNSQIRPVDGRLWETYDTGHDGEPLGTDSGIFKGEGKHIPAHLRKSHRIFVEEIKCDQCNDPILERCESCSVRMHCMGCRKTLCASCAFNRPIPRKRAKTRHFASLAFGYGAPFSNPSANPPSARGVNSQKANRFWWAPGATRSPNLMNEVPTDDDSSDSDDNVNGMPPPPSTPPKLNMQWCCLEPIFSGGGGIAVLGTGLGGRGADKIRAAPLPRTQEFQDPDFSSQLRPVDYVRELKNNGLYEYVLGEDVDMLAYLRQDNLDLQASTCPRGLCQDCYRSFRWKVSCRACKKPLCKEHDFRGLKIRKCGYRDLQTEREYVRTHNEPHRLVIPAFKAGSSTVFEGAPSLNSHASTSTAELASNAIDTDSEAEQTPLTQSQILPPAASAVNMSTSTSMTSHDSTQDPLAATGSSSASPFLPISSSRPRSLSVSGLRSSKASWQNSPRNINPVSHPLPLPCNPRHPVQWEGCGAYFCQSPRPVGDSRPRCPAVMKECGSCGVQVCDACFSTQPCCTCTFCANHYHCPHCFRKKEVKAKCRLQDELKAKREAEIKAKEKMEREKADRDQADHLAESVWEFWEGLYGEDGPNQGAAANEDVMAEVEAALMTAVGGLSIGGGLTTTAEQDATSITPTAASSITVPTGLTIPLALSHEPVAVSSHYSTAAGLLTDNSPEHIEIHVEGDGAGENESQTTENTAQQHEDEGSDDAAEGTETPEELDDDDILDESAVLDEFIDESALIPTAASSSLITPAA